VVYGIVTNHRGFIDMASEPGHGTTFDIYLPLPSDATTLIPAATAGEEKKTEQTAANGATILFVEDETHQLNLMQKHLVTEGYRVLTAKDGAEAVQTYLLHKQEIDLVVLDLGLPKLNGWEAFKMMKGAHPEVKALFATGFVSPEIEAHLQTEDSSAVITKPYSPEDMRKKIATVLQKPTPVPVLARPAGQSSDLRNQ
jgi:DNA-binding response OmpR family regulator